MSGNRVKAVTLLAMCSALFMANIDDTAVNVALPQIQASLGINILGLQWILNAYTLPAASLVLPSGTLADIYGRKRVFLSALVIFTISSAVCGFSSNLGILIAGRTFQGIGDAALIPTSLSILADTFPDPKQQAKAFGLWTGVSGLALVAGPALGGLLVNNLGWQSVFFLNLPLGAIAFVMISRVVKESKNPSKQRLDVPGLILSVVLLASLTYALSSANNGIWRSPIIIWLFAAAFISLAGFLAVESTSSHPMLPLKLFHNPTFSALNIVSIFVFFALISLLFIFSLFLQQVQGYSAIEAGVRFLPMNGAFVIASLVSGWLAARLGRRCTIAAGLILAGVVTFLFLGISTDTPYGAIWWKLAVSGFGGGLALALIPAATMSAAPPKSAGIASAIHNTSSRLGGVFGVAIQGTIFMQCQTLDIKRSLSALGIPRDLQDRLVADALHGAAKVPTDLSATISTLALHQAINNAFVSGFHAVAITATIAFLTGALLIIVFVRSTSKDTTKNFTVSANRER